MQRQPLRSRIPLKALIVAHGVRRRRYRKSPDLASEGGAAGRDAAASHAGPEADAARPVSPATAQATMRRGYTRQPHHLDAGAAATPGPASRRPASRSRQSPRAGGHRRVPRGPGSGSPPADDKGQPATVRWSPFARRIGFVQVGGAGTVRGERTGTGAMCLVGKPSKRKTKPIPVSVDPHPPRLLPSARRPQGAPGAPAATAIDSGTGPPTLSRRLGQHSRSPRTAQPSIRKRPPPAEHVEVRRSPRSTGSEPA